MCITLSSSLYDLNVYVYMYLLSVSVTVCVHNTHCSRAEGAVHSPLRSFLELKQCVSHYHRHYLI